MSRERVAKAGILSLFGGGTGAVFGFVLAIVVGRGLGEEGTGYFFQMVALFMILANVLEFGADTGLVRELSRQVSLNRFGDLRRTVVIAVFPVVVVGGAVLTVLWLAAPTLARLISTPGDQPITTALILHTAPLILPASLVTVLLGGTRGLGSVLPFTGLYNISLPIARVIGVLLVFAAGSGLLAAAHAWAWPFVLTAGAAAVIVSRQLTTAVAQPSVHWAPVTPTRHLIREFWSFSAPRAVAAALEIGLVWIDVLIVAALLGPAPAGIYAVISRCAQSGLLVETAMRMAVSPRISATLARKDLPAARALHLNTTRAMILLAWPFYVTLAVFAPLILELFGPGFPVGAGPLGILAVAMFLWTGAGMVQTVLLMGGRSSWQMSNKAVALAVNIVGNLVFVPLWGISGAAAAWALTIAVDTGLATWQVQHHMGVRLPVRRLLLPIAIVLGTVGVPGLLLRMTFGPTLPALGVHLALVVPLLAAVCWHFRDHLGIVVGNLLPVGRLRNRSQNVVRQ